MSIWPKRIAVREFIEEYFMECSRPNVETIKANIKLGAIPGEVIGRKYYVFIGPHGELMAPTEMKPEDAMVEKLLADWEAAHGEIKAA